jgi:hypothetical protein
VCDFVVVRCGHDEVDFGYACELASFKQRFIRVVVGLADNSCLFEELGFRGSVCVCVCVSVCV